MIIGVDFDNTIIDFDPVFHKLALKEKLIDAATAPHKRAIRDSIRKKFGNDRWTELQGVVYSKGVDEARMTDGFSEFLSWAGDNAASLYVISHKTERAESGAPLDLRVPALSWLKRQGFHERNIFFESTREKKLERIGLAGCRYFVDDLYEIFEEPGFPKEVKAVFYNPYHEACPDKQVLNFRSWREIRKFFETCR